MNYVEDNITYSIETHGPKLKFKELRLSRSAIKISSVNVARAEDLIAIQISFKCCSLDKNGDQGPFSCRVIGVKVNGMEIEGNIIVELTRFTPELPFFEKAVARMPKPPNLDVKPKSTKRLKKMFQVADLIKNKMFPIILYTKDDNIIEDLRNEQVPDHRELGFEWINEILKGLWPSVKTYVMEEIKIWCPQPINIDSLHLGETAPVVLDVKTRDLGERLFIDVVISYDAEFRCSTSWYEYIEFEIYTKVQAELNIELQEDDLVGHMPIVQKMNVLMNKIPTIHADLKKMASCITPIARYVLYFIARSLKNGFPYTVQF